MKVIAQRGKDYLLVPDDAEPGENVDGVITDGESTEEINAPSALSRGYWEEPDDVDPDELLPDDFEQKADIPDEAEHINSRDEAGPDEQVVEGPQGGLYKVPEDADGSGDSEIVNEQSLEEAGLEVGTDKDTEDMSVVEYEDGSKEVKIEYDDEPERGRNAERAADYMEEFGVEPASHDWDEDENVLYTEFIDGEPLGEMSSNDDIDEESLLDAFAANYVVNNADPTASNYIVDEDGEVHPFDLDFAGMDQELADVFYGESQDILFDRLGVDLTSEDIFDRAEEMEDELEPPDFEDVELTKSEMDGLESKAEQEVEAPLGHVVEIDDETVRFEPEFSKEDADYHAVDDDEFDSSHSNCGSCAFFIDGGGCMLVQGQINPDGYCEQFYSDVIVTGHAHTDQVAEEVTIFGEDYDWNDVDIAEFLAGVNSILSDEVSTKIAEKASTEVMDTITTLREDNVEVDESLLDAILIAAKSTMHENLSVKLDDGPEGENPGGSAPETGEQEPLDGLPNGRNY